MDFTLNVWCQETHPVICPSSQYSSYHAFLRCFCRWPFLETRAAVISSAIIIFMCHKLRVWFPRKSGIITTLWISSVRGARYQSEKKTVEKECKKNIWTEVKRIPLSPKAKGDWAWEERRNEEREKRKTLQWVNVSLMGSVNRLAFFIAPLFLRMKRQR